MIPPCRDTEDRQALVDIAHDAGNRVQHGPFVTSSHPKLERHLALVVLSERHVDVRVWPGITERVLDRRDDADHKEWQPRSRSLGVEELNQPSECSLPRPQRLGERIVDDRYPLSGAGCQFGVAEIPAAKHGKSEDARVVAADDAEYGAHGPRSRIGCAGRRDVATVPDGRERRTRSDGHRFDAGDRSQPIDQREMRFPSRFVVPGQSRVDLHDQSAVEAKSRIGRRRRQRAHHEQSTGGEQEQRQRDLPDDQGIADPHASRPASFVAGATLEIGRGRATGQRQGRPGSKDQRGDETERQGAEEDSPVETDVGRTHGNGST